ncbi:MAG: AMP-binding protein, partial [bacterium]|nr:AMP-binding protein [bacterium]
TPKAIVGKNESVLHFIQWEMDTFRVDHTVNVSQLIFPGFDAFLRDVFVPLCSGGKLCIPSDPDTRTNGNALSCWLESRAVNLIHCVPSLFRILQPHGLQEGSFKNLRHVLLSGEKINAPDIVDWFQTFDERITFANLYGPTETTMTKTCHIIAKDDFERPRIPVGKPMRGVGVMILDEEMNICNPLVMGDIYICTPYITHGYYNDPDLNGERFLRNPFGHVPGNLLYNTGDIGRLLADGGIDLIGRRDRQLKVRGIRIEPGEIENVMLEHPTVKEAVVIKKELSNGNELLSAYVTTPRGDGETELGLPDDIAEHVSRTLPGYMVPTAISVIESIPRKPNGKVDYDALSALETNPVAYAAPTNDVERELVTIWQETFGKENVGIRDPFFSMGGNSLNALTVSTRIQRHFEVAVPSLPDMFQNPTIEILASSIAVARKKMHSAIPPVEEKDYYPLSSAQKRLYILQQMEPQSIGYNMPRVMELLGTIDPDKLERAFQRLIRRHESLRTSFLMVDGETMQRVHPRGQAGFEIQKGDRQSKQGKQGRLTKSDFVRPFDLDRAPLMRVMLTTLEETRHILTVDMHHIISDGVSYSILIRDFMALYQGRELTEPPIRYRDYCQWRAGPQFKDKRKQQETYWLDQFSGTIPLLDLPLDYSRPPKQSFEGESLIFRIDEERTRQLNQLAAKEGGTLYMVLLSSFYLLLSKLSSREDIVIGVPTAGRTHDDVREVIGIFLNMMALRAFPSEEKTFTAFLGEIKTLFLEASDNQDYPFEDLVDRLKANRSGARNPLFDVMLVLQNQDMPQLNIPGVTLKPVAYEDNTSKFDLSFNAVELDG